MATDREATPVNRTLADQVNSRASQAPRAWHGRRGRLPRATGIALLSAAALALSLMAAPLAAASPAARQDEAVLPAAPVSSVSAAPQATCDGQPAPWMNTRLSPSQRAGLLVSQMTLAQETG